ncbi:EAL domain-containing protein [Altererythrobacter sp. TH136]|nr:EAL domain-containing protein [Altererythrobacter sp. TH136]
MDQYGHLQARGTDRSATGRARPWFSGGRRRSNRMASLSNARLRIVLWAIAFGLIAGAIELFLPIEDSYRAIRAMTREHPSDGKTVMVFVDDRSLDALGVSDPDRADDATVLETLFAMGAQRVFFDRLYADRSTNPKGDAALAASMRRHKAKTFIGGTGRLDGTGLSLYPNPLFRDAANIVALDGEEGPLGLSAKFPTIQTVRGRQLPSLSAELAGYRGPGGWYPIDLAIDYTTIPRVSYMDVLNKQVDPGKFSGKDVVVAPFSRTQPDLHPIPFNKKIPGALMHVMGAETLRKGYPTNLGWLPAFAVVCGLIVYLSRRNQPSGRTIAAAFAVLIALPFALDWGRISIDIMPALLCLTIAAARLRRLAREAYRGSTSLQNFSVLQRDHADDQVDVIALKIRNFGTISALLTPEQVDELLTKAQAMLQATDEAAEFAFDKDTFIWLASRLRQGDLEDHLRGLHALFSTSISVSGQAPDVASSIGVDTDYVAPLRERTENAIQCAEDAAHAGRIFMVAEPRMVEDRVWRLQILSELESAIRKNEVDVAFQPKYSLTHDTIVGAEALLRWQHPVRGFIEPSQVVAIAEEHNRVDMITRFVLTRAISEARRALTIDPAFTIAVNISALDLHDPLFVGKIEHLLGRFGFPAANLMLEITETAPVEDDEVIATALQSLKQLGVKLSVDDFGTGHGSLHYLRRIPADEVKIDRSFVTGMESSSDDRALVRSAIEMIHSLGRTAVAEGVENQAVVDLLRAMNCDTAQGYHFARAQTMAELLARMGASSIAA